MPRRDDIHKILIIGSGPIIIGQACEFDYSGSQACRSLKEEGYEVVLINSNPATIMTDPMMADKIYLKPLTTKSIKEIVEIENPDAVLPTMGGQTGLNLARDLQHEGFWQANDIHIIGVDIGAIDITEDRQQFRDLMEKIGIDQCRKSKWQSPCSMPKKLFFNLAASRWLSVLHLPWAAWAAVSSGLKNNSKRKYCVDWN